MTATTASGRNAIITGGLTGIGLAIAHALSAQGVAVALGGRRAKDDALRSAALAVAPGAFIAVLDVREPDTVTEFLAGAEDANGPVDILVNAAGVSIHQDVATHDHADWMDVIDINLNGPFRMIRACLPGMIARRRGRIVNIASTAARIGAADHAAYCASKSGLLGLSRCVAIEGAPHGVACTTVSPTWVETPMLHISAEERAAAKGTTPAAEKAAIAALNPQNRLVPASEIASLVSYLCTDAPRSLTMEDIQVNAGAYW